ncbi:MAG: hypothetical protein ACXWI6_22910 [Burkholderiales bacterium]
MMIPHLLFSVSWALLLDPSNGMMNIVLKNALFLEAAPFNIYSLPGMILVEGRWWACDDGLWGKLSALGIIMILITTALVILATLLGAIFKAVEGGG